MTNNQRQWSSGLPAHRTSTNKTNKAITAIHTTAHTHVKHTHTLSSPSDTHTLLSAVDRKIFFLSVFHFLCTLFFLNDINSERLSLMNRYKRATLAELQNPGLLTNNRPVHPHSLTVSQNLIHPKIATFSVILSQGKKDVIPAHFGAILLFH